MRKIYGWGEEEIYLVVIDEDLDMEGEEYDEVVIVVEDMDDFVYGWFDFKSFDFRCEVMYVVFVLELWFWMIKKLKV